MEKTLGQFAGDEVAFKRRWCVNGSCGGNGRGVRGDGRGVWGCRGYVEDM